MCPGLCGPGSHIRQQTVHICQHGATVHCYISVRPGIGFRRLTVRTLGCQMHDGFLEIFIIIQQLLINTLCIRGNIAFIGLQFLIQVCLFCLDLFHDRYHRIIICGDNM